MFVHNLTVSPGAGLAHTARVATIVKHKPRSGRPQKEFSGPAELRNQLRALRNALGLTLEEVADASGVGRSQLNNYELGKKPIKGSDLPKLAQYYGVSRGAIYDPAPPSVPLRYLIGDPQHEGFAGAPELAPPFTVIAADDIDNPEQCFAARIVDDSADQRFRPGTVLLARDVERDRELRQRDLVIVRRLIDAATRDTWEILCGYLQFGLFDTIELRVPTRNRRWRDPITIRSAARATALEEAHGDLTPDRPLAYSPQPGDDAEILGRVIGLAKERYD